MNTEALSYSRTKGLFVGIAVDGAVIQQDNDSTVAFYGKNVSFRKTLSGDVHAPARNDSFLATVRAAVNKANQHEAAESK
jgi:lipid-binding SYLF domain-containing protein